MIPQNTTSQTNGKPSQNVVVTYNAIYEAVAEVETRYVHPNRSPFWRIVCAPFAWTSPQSLREQDYLLLVQGHETLEALMHQQAAETPQERSLAGAMKETQKSIQELMHRFPRKAAVPVR